MIVPSALPLFQGLAIDFLRKSPASSAAGPVDGIAVRIPGGIWTIATLHVVVRFQARDHAGFLQRLRIPDKSHSSLSRLARGFYNNDS